MAKRRRRRKKIFKTVSPWLPVRERRPIEIIIWTTLAVALAVITVVFVLVPLGRKLFNVGITENPIPSPTTNPVIDITDKIKEVLFTYKYKYVSAPAIIGNEIYFSSGTNAAGNPRLSKIYYHKMETANSELNPDSVPGIELINDNILSININANYILYFDAKSAGGGDIFAYDRAATKTIHLKKVQYGTPEVKLAGDKAVWMERTSQTQSKLYMMDINTLELTTLEVFEDSPFGFSDPGVSDTEIVWAAPDPNHAGSNNFGIIKALKFDDPKNIEIYSPEMYVHDPVTNGRARAWIDKDEGTNATLYFSIYGTMPKKLAENVSNYGIGVNFIAWCSKGQIFAYFWNEGIVAKVSSDTELAVLAEVSARAVAWFDISAEVRERDVLKYAVLD